MKRRRLLQGAAFVGLPLMAAGGFGAWSFADEYLALEWPSVPADAAGFEPARLEALSQELIDGGTRAFVVVRQGRLVHEAYGAGDRYTLVPRSQRRFGMASMAKAVVGTPLLLKAIDRGWLDLETRAARFIPEWRDDPLRSQITIGDLATHTSGLVDAKEPGMMSSELPPGDWRRIYWEDRASRYDLARTRAQPVEPPGRHVRYSNPGWSALGYILASVLAAHGDDEVLSFLAREIMAPLDIPGMAWKISYGERFEGDGLGLYELGGGARYTGRAVARVGEMMRARGLWQGREIIAPAVFDAAMRPRLLPHASPASAARQPVPRLGWWSNANGAWRSAPADTFIGAGAEHKFVVAIPSLEITGVRLGEPMEGDRWQGDFWVVMEEQFLKPLLGSLRA